MATAAIAEKTWETARKTDESSSLEKCGSVLKEIGISESLLQSKGIEMLRTLRIPDDDEVEFQPYTTVKNFLINYIGSISPISCTEVTESTAGKTRKFWVSQTKKGTEIARGTDSKGAYLETCLILRNMTEISLELLNPKKP